MKKCKEVCVGAILAFGAGTLAPVAVLAEGHPTDCEGIDNCAVVTTGAEFDAFFSEGEDAGFVTRDGKSTMIIGADFALTTDYYIENSDISMYLGNYTITADDWSLLVYNSTLNIYAENGELSNDGENTYYAPLYVRNDSNVTMNGGVIRGGSVGGYDSAVNVERGGTFTLNDGAIYGASWVVSVYGDSEFIMNGGSVTTTAEESIGVSGNGTTNPASSNYGGNAKLTLNAGTINSNDLGVYAPQVNGVTTLGAGLTINAAKAGVEIRAGELNVNGATINVPDTAEYVFNPNGSGSTASGVAIAVAQHTTKQPITANVTAGSFTAPVVLAEANPQGNEDEDIAKVSVNVSGGEFNAYSDDTVVASEDVTGFISGGVFNKPFDPSFLASGYEGYENPQDVWTVDVAVANPEAGIPEMILIEKGETYTLALDATVAKYIESGVADKNVATLDGTTITGMAAGETLLNLNLHMMGRGFNQPVPVYVYDLDDEDADVHADVESTLIDEDDIEPEVLEALTESTGDKKVLGYYEINVKVYSGDNLVGEVNETQPIEVKIEKPELPELAEGFTRKFYVIRYHDGETTIIEATLDGDYIVFTNDKFSTFALAYEDVAADGVSAPETGAATAAGTDMKVNAIIVAVIVSVITGMVAGWKLVAKRM